MTNPIKVRTIEEGAFPVNEKLAGIVPMATPEEQAALTEDINKVGQREPIKLWKGKVVDGRCRQKALILLQRHILYSELDDELTESEVEAFVKSINTRRNLTETQKVAIAAKEYLHGKKCSVKQLAKSWGISTSMLDNGIWIGRNNPEILQKLFEGKSVPIVNSKNMHVTSNRITAVYSYLKRESQKVETDHDHGWKEWSQIHTQKGKDLFYKEVAMLHSIDSALRDHLKIVLIEYVNLKFKLIEETDENN